MVLCTTSWSKSSNDTFDVDDGCCYGCCCMSCAFFFSSTTLWAVGLLTPVSAEVLSHTRFSDSFIPDFFSSMHNLYTFSIIALASSLYMYLYTSLAILLSEVALHVHNASKHAFFCKHVNREKFPASLRKQKIKKSFTGARTLNFVFIFFEYNRYTYCAIESLVKVHL